MKDSERCIRCGVTRPIGTIKIVPLVFGGEPSTAKGFLCKREDHCDALLKTTVAPAATRVAPSSST